MFYVALEILQRIHLCCNLLYQFLLVAQYLVERHAAESETSHKIKVLAEREAPEVVTLCNVAQFRILLLQTHHTRTREYNLQLRIHVVACSEFLAPFLLLIHLINEQHPTSLTIELASEVSNTSALKVEVVHVDIEAASVVRLETLLYILQQESRLSHSTRSLDAYHTSTPIYLVHQTTTNGSITLLY